MGAAKKLVAFRFSMLVLHRLDNLVQAARHNTRDTLWPPRAGRTSVLCGLVNQAFDLASRAADSPINANHVKRPKKVTPIKPRPIKRRKGKVSK